MTPPPFFCRHVLREARRGKAPQASPDLCGVEKAELEEVITSAYVSGFVRDAPRNPWDPPLRRMELTREGVAELARLELEHGDEQFVLRELLAVMETLAIHELREWTRLDGRPLVEPHPEIYGQSRQVLR